MFKLFHNSSRKKEVFEIGDIVEFINDMETHCMFASTSVIKKGTKGFISDKDVTLTVYNTRFYRNIQVSHGKGNRTLSKLKDSHKYLKVVVKKEDADKVKDIYKQFSKRTYN